MFDGYGREAKEAAPCKRDYEYDAKRIKNRIDGLKDFHLALTRFMSSDLRYEAFDGRDEHTPFLALIGGLSLSIPKLEKEYEFLLKKMEEGGD